MSVNERLAGSDLFRDELTVRALHGDDSFMKRIAFMALGCLGTALFFAACSDDTKTGSTSSSNVAGAGGGSSSSSTGGAGGGTGGGQGGCTIDADCSPSGPCKSVACVDGACVEQLVPPGTLVNVQSGDCKRQECGATGDVVDINDDNDQPQDYNPCTIDSCTNGVPSNTPDTAKNGLSCGSGQSKCQDGVCAGCNSPSNCPVGGICDKPTCSAQKVCGLAIDVGKVVSNVDAMDCFVQACDAAGVVQKVAAPGEQPMQDANECDIEVCGSNGIEHQAVPDGTTCSGSTECNPRACSNAQCTDLPFPGMDIAVAVQMSGDCKIDVCDGSGGVVSKNDDQDPPADPNPGDCTLIVCANGVSNMMLAPAGTVCTTPGGTMGTCSATGVCSS